MKRINPITFVLSLMVALLFRLVKGFGVPNFEPVMGTMMPFAKQGGSAAGLVFACVSVILFDLISGTLGPWTPVNAIAYAVVGYCAGRWFEERAFTRRASISFAIVATLAYDLVTGVIATPIMYPMTFSQALVGQISFTLYHLAGNIVFAAVISPLLYTYIMQNPRFAWRREVLAHT